MSSGTELAKLAHCRTNSGVLLLAGLEKDLYITVVNCLAESMGENLCLAQQHPMSFNKTSGCQLWWQRCSVSAMPNEKPWSLGNTCWSAQSWKQASLPSASQQSVASSPGTNRNTLRERNIHSGTPSSTGTALLMCDEQPKSHAKESLCKK